MSRPMELNTVAVLPSAVGVPYSAADLSPRGSYYAYNPNVEQWPSPSNGNFIMNGGRRRRTRYGKKSKKGKKTGKKQRGGSFSENISKMFTTLVPEEIVNITRSLPASVGHMYDKYNGATPSASSMVYPTEQPLVHKIYTDVGSPPSDIGKIYNVNSALVSRI